ncbi:MAG: phosphoglycerate mutase (2,3-diphosphoglycerate-independent) [Bacteroidetes bacterium RIFOXYA12_FULL_35_11]|nr:MAG: phosphoglycerate mutase (2,3-diphosphoglycerate-independent) [Bacteroidetes bacterium GWF2_35_48]OFY80581.1 MAG: phosphoglycerate mutase (2,3-diphosphoglycerate-independent) [Bacteroidetes bacterium RIFOXYA12_FULL_35_11]OFZ05899.1 MAG: phosphoglycerate mutase (2,3-diphosphoglycerate-independent) [Bacteroidetes bacterium RIFOXYC12_FULL_35_7]HBX50042.1 2,3-bisphosphoglycerate-independent phosphoglycerate mutase [Bacteroidales bacterium]
MINKCILIILDGWGIGNKSKADVIFQGETPVMDKLKSEYPNSQLLASGEDVGLPEGQMGNSEVGHLNIGAGRVVYQELVRINKACKENTIFQNKALMEAFTYAKENNKAVHFIGLVSDGGVHSMDTHLYKLCDMTKDYQLSKVYIHALTDGRDTDPRSGLGFVKNLQNHLKNSYGEIASLAGRYYTMDRDKRWERVKIGYDLLVHGTGKATNDIVKAVQESYDEGITDEFIKPIIKVDEAGKPIATVKKGDVFICFNFRTDRLREITIALTQKNMPEFGMQTMPLKYYTMTSYDETFKNVTVIYENDNVTNTLGQVVSENKLKQLRIAETEKYAHVSFFFSGGREEPFEGESRVMIPSPKVATYDLQPEMSAFLVKNAIVAELNKKEHDFVCLNFANGDMVGHTGIYEAILKAVNTVDTCVGEVIKAAKENGYTALIIADHGNADYAINDDGSPNTAHSLNPVPCILVSDKYSKINNGILADIAPTILTIMGLPVPKEMTGKVLVN